MKQLFSPLRTQYVFSVFQSGIFVRIPLTTASLLWKALTSRETDPLGSSVISVTKIQGADANNVMPGAVAPTLSSALLIVLSL